MVSHFLSIVINFIIWMEHQVSLIHCTCESLVESMARVRLWPSSPVQPKFACTFKLLDWFEALLLECQVAFNRNHYDLVIPVLD